MRTPWLSTLLFTCLAAAAFGQTVPYAAFKEIEDSAEQLRQIEGAKAELKLEHTDPADTRTFQITLETPAGKQPVKVNQDGTFRLPKIPADVQPQATLTHSLEKGALTIDLNFNWNGSSTETNNPDTNSVFENCSTVAKPLIKAEPVFAKLGESYPEFKDFQIAFVGVYFSREKPCPGKALLKHGKKTVSVIDLSQTGKATWLFSDYDPRTHWIDFEMKKGEPSPKIYYKFETGKEAAGKKGAILVWNLK